jgi:antitoxin component of MazEF toxin-antitoxin module
MALVKKVTQHGNSAGVIFDRAVLRQVGWEVGTEVEIRVDKGERVILTRHQYASDEAVKESADRMVKRHRKSLERLGR